MLTPTQREEVIKLITDSQLSAETKERALLILRKTEHADADSDTILEIIREDIEADFARIPGANESLMNNAEFTAFVENQEKELKAVEKEVQETIATVEHENAQIRAEEGKAKLDDVKSRLGL